MAGEKLEDFFYHQPTGNYFFEPTRELWPAKSVNNALAPIPVRKKNGRPLIRNGQRVTIKASAWIACHRAVQLAIWAPGEGVLIRNKLLAEGGWIPRKDAACFNLYREPLKLTGGNAKKAKRWLDHIRLLYPDDVEHIVKWFAHRVRFPHIKINHALVFGGGQGIGKDTIIEPVKVRIGHWNFQEIGPSQLLEPFNDYLRKVLLRVNEAHDLGEINRYSLYDRLKTYTAAPPDVLRVNEKKLRQYNVINCLGLIITSNHRDGLFLPPDDRRHYVCWCELEKEDFSTVYWNEIYHWYEHENGYAHVAAYLDKLNLKDFDPKAPPPHTNAWHSLVNINRAPEEAELADVLDKLGNPHALTLEEVIEATPAFDDFNRWLSDRKNRRAIPHRFEAVGYIPFRNRSRKDGLWVVGGERRVIYVDKGLTSEACFKAVAELQARVDAAIAKKAQKRAEKAEKKGAKGVRF
jgi:hypothetical protein